MDFLNKVRKCLTEIKNGNQEGNDNLFDLTFFHLLGVARNYLIDKSKAEDVVMDAYEKVLKYINTYNENENGYNWLCRIVQNAAFAQNNIDKKNQMIVDSVISVYNEIDEKPVSLDVKMDLMNAIERLDNDGKDLIFSYYFLGKKLGEIAKEKGISAPATKKRIDRLVKKLKKFLTNG